MLMIIMKSAVGGNIHNDKDIVGDDCHNNEGIAIYSW